MKKIIVRLGERSYPIWIGVSLKNLGSKIESARKALIVTQPFAKKYEKIAANSLLRSKIQPSFVYLPTGEKQKNLQTVQALYHKCLQEKLDRSSCIIALGGGVVGDIAGFVAATYLRGISLIQVPTTLLAMVDSSIGGKVGVDLAEAKNYVGSIYQPTLVWIDETVLQTLPEREFRNGLAEVIKYGVIADKNLFEILEKNLSLPLTAYCLPLRTIIPRCVSIKARIVSKDERETKGLREILNFGHTLGHAIETLTHYREYSHGEAISIGMCAAGAIAQKLGLWNSENQRRLTNLLFRTGLPLFLRKRLSEKSVATVLMRDKKLREGELRYVLPVRIGKVIVKKIPLKLALAGLRSVQPAHLS